MFALVCGSSVATVAAVGAIVLPEMVRNGYPMRFGAGIITVAGSLGILMLPSIPKIIYAVSTNTSIGALFVAGLLPGMLLTSMLCVVTGIWPGSETIHAPNELGETGTRSEASED
jgi:C4-dicarboxylate transporter DctM subunit